MIRACASVSARLETERHPATKDRGLPVPVGVSSLRQHPEAVFVEKLCLSQKARQRARTPALITSNGRAFTRSARVTDISASTPRTCRAAAKELDSQPPLFDQGHRGLEQRGDHQTGSPRRCPGRATTGWRRANGGELQLRRYGDARPGPDWPWRRDSGAGSPRGAGRRTSRAAPLFHVEHGTCYPAQHAIDHGTSARRPSGRLAPREWTRIAASAAGVIPNRARRAQEWPDAPRQPLHHLVREAGTRRNGEVGQETACRARQARNLALLREIRRVAMVLDGLFQPWPERSGEARRPGGAGRTRPVRENAAIRRADAAGRRRALRSWLR